MASAWRVNGSSGGYSSGGEALEMKRRHRVQFEGNIVLGSISKGRQPRLRIAEGEAEEAAVSMCGATDSGYNCDVGEIWQCDQGLQLQWLDCVKMATKLQDLGGEVAAEIDSGITPRTPRIIALILDDRNPKVFIEDKRLL
ncbi:hypothetical protein B296_00015351 [Ensete ventricosum]|uniref:Uncharacterized protein n=1 Tax=Ensete ventricosum TaxID=4639 RepID=A0A426XBU9_ENSVE|nr:hypothetical protein B296_00015351 [Ensete ventricosum]